jgi:hypothetical protein
MSRSDGNGIAPASAAEHEAELYAAQVLRILTTSDNETADIAILDRLCEQAAQPNPPFDCNGIAWPADIRNDLGDLLSDHGGVHWVDSRSDVPAFGDPQANSHTVLIVFGQPDTTDRGSRLAWSAWTIPIGGQGQTDMWTFGDGRWNYVGVTNDPIWIS